jgi:hypothetical protein
MVTGKIRKIQHRTKRDAKKVEKKRYKSRECDGAEKERKDEIVVRWRWLWLTYKEKTNQRDITKEKKTPDDAGKVMLNNNVIGSLSDGTTFRKENENSNLKPTLWSTVVLLRLLAFP